MSACGHIRLARSASCDAECHCCPGLGRRIDLKESNLAMQESLLINVKHKTANVFLSTETDQIINVLFSVLFLQTGAHSLFQSKEPKHSQTNS